MKKIRIGSGAGYGGDRLEPALDLIEKGDLNYIGFECLAERTIALAQKEMKNNPQKGYNHLLEYRMEKVLPLVHKHGVKVITNMGAANPRAAMLKVGEIAKKQGIQGLKIAAVMGDDVLHLLPEYLDSKILETGKPLSTISDHIISANAYLGVEGIVDALKAGADIIITGRVADPALFLAPMIYEFGWEMTDLDKLGKGTLIGHLLECAAQVCGGYFADPSYKKIPDLWDVGFPLVEVDESGAGYITKVKDSGGLINVATCTEQLLYEIHDPENYFTPDCVADFSKVEFKELRPNLVEFTHASGKSATDTYKVSVGYHKGYFGEGQISYGGFNCLERAKLASEIVRKRLGKYEFEDLRIELIGLDSIAPMDLAEKPLNEVRLRVSGRANSKEAALKIGREVETLYTNGPAGGGGAFQSVEEVVAVASILLHKSKIQTEVNYLTT